MSIDTARTIATLRGLTTRFDNAVKAAAPYWPTKCTYFPSRGRDEGYGGLGNVPGMREWLGERHFASLGAQQFVIANRKWESSIAIEKDDIQDDRLGVYSMVFDQLGVEATYHPDELLFQAQIAGDSNVCMDGQYFYDTDHQFGDSGVQSNKLTFGISVAPWVASATYVAGAIVRNNGNQYVCTVGGTAAGSGGPTTQANGITDGTVTWNFQSIALPSENDVRQAYFNMQSAILGFKRDNGKTYYRPTLEPITDFVLEVPAQLQQVVTQALFKEMIQTGQSNLIINKPAKVVTIPSFTDNYSIYLNRVSQPLKPFVFQDRQPLARSMKGLDDREFKDVKFMTDARYNVGYFAWWNTVKLTFG